MSSSSASKIDRQAIGNSQHGSRFTDSTQLNLDLEIRLRQSIRR
jgi:hypothetical protein